MPAMPGFHTQPEHLILWRHQRSFLI
ncbi:MAG: hypothetical protein WDW36_000447 [Sanguina aurantia]